MAVLLRGLLLRVSALASCVKVGSSLTTLGSSLGGATATRATTGEVVDVGELLGAPSSTTLAIFSTYAGDFNAIEYAQRLRHYLPKLREKGCERFVVIANAEPAASARLAELVGLDASVVEIYGDPTGAAGRAFGVGRGWLPERDAVDLWGGARLPLSPYVKLFGMLWGLGAWATLPAVVGGYLGNPFRSQPWIGDAMRHNSDSGRWPRATADEFADLPVVGSWGRRPLELATLRLQNMLGISLQYWDDLKPTDDNLHVLTQLGGCCLVDPKGGLLYEWRDPGICAVANFEDILRAL